MSAGRVRARNALLQWVIEAAEPKTTDAQAKLLSAQWYAEGEQVHPLRRYAFPFGKPPHNWHTYQNCFKYLENYKRRRLARGERATYLEQLYRLSKLIPEIRESCSTDLNLYMANQYGTDHEWLQMEATYERFIGQLTAGIPTLERVKQACGHHQMEQYRAMLEGLEHNGVCELDVEEALHAGRGRRWTRALVTHILTLLEIYCTGVDVCGGSDQSVVFRVEVSNAYRDYTKKCTQSLKEKQEEQIRFAKNLGVWRVKACDVDRWVNWDQATFQEYQTTVTRLKQWLPPRTARWVPQRRFGPKSCQDMRENIFRMKKQIASK